MATLTTVFVAFFGNRNGFHPIHTGYRVHNFTLCFGASEHNSALFFVNMRACKSVVSKRADFSSV
jgi:hypothetical protein